MNFFDYLFNKNWKILESTWATVSLSVQRRHQHYKDQCWLHFLDLTPYSFNWCPHDSDHKLHKHSGYWEKEISRFCQSIVSSLSLVPSCADRRQQKTHFDRELDNKSEEWRREGSSCRADINFYPIGNLWDNTAWACDPARWRRLTNRRTMWGMAAETSRLWLGSKCVEPPVHVGQREPNKTSTTGSSARVRTKTKSNKRLWWDGRTQRRHLLPAGFPHKQLRP